MAHAHFSSFRYLAATMLSRLGVGICATFILSACTESNRCLGRQAPQLDTAVLASAVLNQVYTQVIRASIKNSIEDDNFRYSFSLIGELPAGLSSRQDDRRFFFEGTPTSSGLYPLELTVRISNENNIFASADVADFCRSSETVAYELNVDTL